MLLFPSTHTDDQLQVYNIGNGTCWCHSKEHNPHLSCHITETINQPCTLSCLVGRLWMTNITIHTVAYMTVTAYYTRSTLQLTSCCSAILIKASIDSLCLHVKETKLKTLRAQSGYLSGRRAGGEGHLHARFHQNFPGKHAPRPGFQHDLHMDT